MTPGTIHTDADLAELAKQVVAERRLTQKQVADQLGVSQPYVSQALNDTGQNLRELRIRIIETFSPYRVETPLHRLITKEGGA